MPKPETFSCSEPELSRTQPRKHKAIEHAQGQVPEGGGAWQRPACGGDAGEAVLSDCGRGRKVRVRQGVVMRGPSYRGRRLGTHLVEVGTEVRCDLRELGTAARCVMRKN